MSDFDSTAHDHDGGHVSETPQPTFTNPKPDAPLGDLAAWALNVLVRADD